MGKKPRHQSPLLENADLRTGSSEQPVGSSAFGEKGKTMSDPWDEWTYDDICYECRGYGDDYYLDDDGELVSACSKCWVTREKDDETN